MSPGEAFIFGTLQSLADIRVALWFLVLVSSLQVVTILSVFLRAVVIDRKRRQPVLAQGDPWTGRAEVIPFRPRRVGGLFWWLKPRGGV